MPLQCSALKPYEQRCKDEATNLNGLFCYTHARMAYNLYKGYERRNAQLDHLNAHPPEYLAKGKTALRNETFATVDDEKEIDEL